VQDWPGGMSYEYPGIAKPFTFCRKLLEPNSKLIHTFFAGNNYDAMAIYYKFMDWGLFTTEFEVDKEPYLKKNAT
jgi:hypothetical protein